jgi:anaphase-promoting complex subunit 1
MGGTGDIETMRVLRMLRKHFEKDMHYGHNMCINMCMGFIFLGAATYTFGQSNFSIAMLLCSLFPAFPAFSADNSIHLQPLRHFYVLAIQTRFSDLYFDSI